VEDLKVYIHVQVEEEKGKQGSRLEKLLKNDRELEDEIVSSVAKKVQGM
jgi:hypothetical protein